MFILCKAAIPLGLLLLALFDLSEAARLCRDCLNGEISYNFTDSVHGNFFSKVTGDCAIVHHAAAMNGSMFDDLGSGKFNFTSADKSWFYFCNVAPNAIGCCDIS